MKEKKQKQRTRHNNREPRLVGDVMMERFRAGVDPLSVAIRQHQHTNHELGIDVYTNLINDFCIEPGKKYLGYLSRDISNTDDPWGRLDFKEVLPTTDKQRCPRLYAGVFLNVTMKPDGRPQPNLKQMPAGMSIQNYAIGVFMELLKSLKGLIEE